MAWIAVATNNFLQFGIRINRRLSVAGRGRVLSGFDARLLLRSRHIYNFLCNGLTTASFRNNRKLRMIYQLANTSFMFIELRHSEVDRRLLGVPAWTR